MIKQYTVQGNHMLSAFLKLNSEIHTFSGKSEFTYKVVGISPSDIPNDYGQTAFVLEFVSCKANKRSHIKPDMQLKLEENFLDERQIKQNKVDNIKDIERRFLNHRKARQTKQQRDPIPFR